MNNALFNHPWIPFTKARSNDPETSQAAAESSKSLVEGHLSEIVECLTDCGPLGVDKIAQYSTLDKAQVYRRMKDLQQSGLVELTGNKVESCNGCWQREWQVTLGV